MMDSSAVKAIVDREWQGMARAMGLHRWKIRFDYGSLEDAAECERDLSYYRATIRFDPARAIDEADVLDSLRHELTHLLLAPFDQYRITMAALIRDDSPESRMEDAAWHYACEHAVISVMDALSIASAPPEAPATSTSDQQINPSILVRVDSVFAGGPLAEGTLYAKDDDDAAYLVRTSWPSPAVGDVISISKDKDGRWTC